MKRKHVLVTVAVGLVLLGVSALSNWRNSPRETGNRKLASVSRGEVVRRVSFAGEVVPNRKTIIKPPYDGYIKKVYVRVGDWVEAGSPIVSISQAPRGFKEEIFPVRAPFRGTVVQVLCTEGEFVKTSTTSSEGDLGIVRIDDLSRLFVRSDIPEVEVGSVRLGQEALVRASAMDDRLFHGRIVSISLAAKEATERRYRSEFPISIELDKSDGDLRPGMSVIVDVIAGKASDVLTLPLEFVGKDKRGYFVVTDLGKKKPVDVGMQNGERFEIRRGLTEGDRVRQMDFLSDFAEL